MKDKKIVFMGTPDFAINVLELLISNGYNVALVVSQPDAYVGRKHVLTETPVKKVALKHNIEVYQPIKIRDEYDRILKVKPDIIITCAYGQIIPDELINLPEYGCINVHSSLLPKYRGGAPIHWARINGDDKTGVTIMYMDKDMDTGDIIVTNELKILDEDTTESLFDKLSIMGANLLIETLPSIFSKTNNRIPQNNDEATYAYNIKREEETIYFDNDGKSIINKIRGLYSWPLANFKIDDIEYKLLEATFEKRNSSTPNKIEITKNTFGITCNDGIIYINKIKPFGKKSMDIKDFLNGIDKEKIKSGKVN